MIEIDHSSCPSDAPERSCRADSGAYIVQPARAAPSGTNMLASIRIPATNADQKEEQAQEQELNPDDLVVGREDVPPDEAPVVVMCVNGVRRRGCGTHDVDAPFALATCCCSQAS